MTKFTTIDDAVVEHIRPGDTAAFEGFTHLIPHAARMRSYGRALVS